MGFLDKIKKNINQDDDDLDELDADLDSEEVDDAPAAASGRGIGGLLGKAKRLGKGKKASGDSDLDDDDDDGGADDTSPKELDVLDADQGDEDEEQPIRRSGFAAALDGKSGAAESSEEGKEDGKEDAEAETEVPVPVAAGAGALDFEALFEEEFVVNPTLKDLAESMDDVSATELATDLKTFLEGLQEPVPPSNKQ